MLNNSLRSTFCHYTFFLIYVSSLVNREFFYFWIEHWTSTILLLSIVYNAQKPSMFYGSYQKKKMLFSDNLNLWGFWEWSWSTATGDSELVPGPTYRQEEVFQRSLLFHLTKEIAYHWNNKLFWQKTHAMTTLFSLVIGNQLLNKIDYFSLLKSLKKYAGCLQILKYPVQD